MFEVTVHQYQRKLIDGCNSCIHKHLLHTYFVSRWIPKNYSRHWKAQTEQIRPKLWIHRIFTQKQDGKDYSLKLNLDPNSTFEYILDFFILRLSFHLWYRLIILYLKLWGQIGFRVQKCWSFGKGNMVYLFNT